MAGDMDLLHAAWVLDWRRQENFVLPAGYDFPRKYLSVKLHEEGRIRSWEIETILTESFGGPKRDGRRIANTKSWSYFAEIVSLLRSAENAESGLNPSGRIFREINRILCRQLPWQARQQNIPDVVRWKSIFSNSKLNDLFVERISTSPDKFMALGLVGSQMFERTAYLPVPKPSSRLNLHLTDISAFLSAVASSLPDIRMKSAEIVRTSGLAFRESALRRTPLIEFQGDGGPSYACPLRQPLFWRITDGLYYDVIRHAETRNLIGSEFEKYQRRLLATAYPHVDVFWDEAYGPDDSIRRTPDILLAQDGQLKIAIECKAKRLPLKDKISLGDDVRQSIGVSELAKAVFQLARFRTDLRSGLFSKVKESGMSQYVVLTLDDWIFTGPATKNDVFSKAEEMLQRRRLAIDFDLRDIVFCTAADLDIFVTRLSLDKLITVFSRNKEPQFREYSPYSLAEDLYEGPAKWRDYPLAKEFNLLSPWSI